MTLGWSISPSVSTTARRNAISGAAVLEVAEGLRGLPPDLGVGVGDRADEAVQRARVL